MSYSKDDFFGGEDYSDPIVKGADHPDRNDIALEGSSRDNEDCSSGLCCVKKCNDQHRRRQAKCLGNPFCIIKSVRKQESCLLRCSRAHIK